jgi:hypothetical protein
MRERFAQAPQLFFALQQLDGRLPVVPCPLIIAPPSALPDP